MPPRYSQGLTIPDFTETSDLWLVTGIPHISITVTANTAPLIAPAMKCLKHYHLFLQPTGHPVISHTRAPRFVSVPTNPPVLASRLHTHTWGLFLTFWQFPLVITPSPSPPGSSTYSSGTRVVQELKV
ncbi:hypothetical protein F5888DRAFT_1814099 [Russula emetica]|nr:hypothetical protein F5888DRAFT_1814099 [Russula emetica]